MDSENPYAAPLTTGPGEVTVPVEYVDLRYKGVKGWLLFLCMGLVVGPLISGVAIFQGIREAWAAFDQYPRFFVISVIDTMLCIPLLVLSLHAGDRLYRVQPGAVAAAKRFFRWFLAYQPVAVGLSFLAGLPSELNQLLISQAIGSLVWALIQFAIWYTYLNRSKRVRATYNS